MFALHSPPQKARGKIKGKKRGTGPLNLLQVTSTGGDATMGGDAATMVTHLFPCTAVTETVIWDQSTDSTSLKNTALFTRAGFQWS